MALEFAANAELLFDERTGDADGKDTYVLLAVNAGMAAADAICIARIGEYNVGEDHRQAVHLLRRAGGPDAALSRLLGMKTKSAYGSDEVSTNQLRVARKTLETLMWALQNTLPPN